MPFRRADGGAWAHLARDGSSTPLASLIAGRKTPFYLYDLDDVAIRLGWFAASPRPVQLRYAMKANHHPAILAVIRDAGAGIDVVSGGELAHALGHGFGPDTVVYSGVAKSADEIRLALGAGIGQINVESEAELCRIAQIAKETSQDARIAIRVNPDVEAITHPYIRTGFRDNKFGVDEADLPALLAIIRREPRLRLRGLSLHIGSQIRDLASFREAYRKTRAMQEALAREFPLDTFDAGGGLGIDYAAADGADDEVTVRNYLALIGEIWRGDDHTSVLLEPGRILVARAGLLVCRVEYVKTTPYKRFVVVDTGMHHLLRPALYDAFHRIEALEPKPGPRAIYDVVGPICESSDTLGADRDLAPVAEGDVVLVFDTGAYGAVMASRYNLHAFPEEVVIE